jgi:superfamily I DNA and/or RNA helicase
LSKEAVKEGFNVSLMERLMALHGPSVSRRLETQYRMNAMIAQFSSDHFYDGALVAHEDVAGHCLSDLDGVVSDPMTDHPLHFYDTAGAGYEEEQEEDGSSRRNLEEARLVVQLALKWTHLGVPANKISIISPYAAQVRLLRERLSGLPIEVDTVDGFQGRETEALLISLVRSNADGEIGFLKDVRRMNVALTRARRGLIVIGDSATIGSAPFYQELLQYFESTSSYHSVWEL